MKVNVRGVTIFDIIFLPIWAKYMQWKTKYQAKRMCIKATKEARKALCTKN